MFAPNASGIFEPLRGETIDDVYRILRRERLIDRALLGHLRGGDGCGCRDRRGSLGGLLGDDCRTDVGDVPARRELIAVTTQNADDGVAETRLIGAERDEARVLNEVGACDIGAIVDAFEVEADEVRQLNARQVDTLRLRLRLDRRSGRRLRRHLRQGQ